jgi:hypothetical protein
VDGSYGEEDVLGQAGLTNAVYDWLEDESKLHPNRLEISLMEFNTILAIFQSAVSRKMVQFPYDPPDDILNQLQKALSE